MSERVKCNIDSSFMDAIKANGAKDIFVSLGEITLDSIVENKIIDEISILKTLSSVH